MSILTNALPAPSEIYTGPWPDGFTVYDWDPSEIASASGHYALQLGSFGEGDAAKASFGVYVIIYEWPFTSISYMPLLPRVLHADFEVIGSDLYVKAGTKSNQLWWHIPGWKPYGMFARAARAARRAGRLFGRKPVLTASLPSRAERAPKPPEEWLR